MSGVIGELFFAVGGSNAQEIVYCASFVVAIKDDASIDMASGATGSLDERGS